MVPLRFTDPVISTDMKEIYDACVHLKQINGCKIYIEGAAGMIASYLVCFLAYLNEVHQYNIQIFAAVRNREKAVCRFADFVGKPYFHLVQKNAIDPVCLESTDIDYIIHAASLASPQYYNSLPVETILPNTIGTYELLKFGMRQRELKKFVFFSSGNIYGTVKGVDGVREENIGVLDFLDNSNCYGESKRCGEMFCHAFTSEFGMPAVSIRIHHAYGPSMDIENDHRAFAEFVKNVLKEENVILTSDGTAKRAFCYITDMIAAVLTVMELGAPGESYNLGNPSEYHSIRTVAETIVGLRPQKGLRVVKKKREEECYRVSPEEDNRFIPVDITKVQTLGWRPQISLRDGFERVIRYFEILR